MLIAQIDFEIVENLDIDKQSNLIVCLLSNFYHEGRVLDWNPSVFQMDNLLRTFASIPDRDAFDNFDLQKSIAEDLHKLKEVGLSKPIFQILGKDIESLDSCACENTSAYILHTHLFSIQSPVNCFDCLKPVPLYRINQNKPEKLRYSIGWQSEYKACDLLQMHCGYGERFALNQMSKLESGLSKIGLEICQDIEKLTQKPCYYYLYKYRGISLKKERARKCPKCNGEWLLDKNISIFDFKCDKCHLLSSIAFDLR